MNDYVPDSSWISVATCDDIGSATVRSGLLLSMGVPASTWTPPRASMPVYVLVAPDRAEEARQILSQPPPSDDELTREALSEPPVDDVPEEASTSSGNREQPIAELGPVPYERLPSTRHPWLYVALGTAVAIVVLKWMLGTLLVQSARVTTSSAPDGLTDALILETDRDAHGEHSLRICLQAHSTAPVTANSCTDVAYLSGVPRGGGGQGVSLIWVDSSQLEIRYIDAKAAYLYRSVFTWPNRVGRLSGRYPASNRLIPISIKLIHTRDSPGGLSDNGN
ncbi:MAG: hypothetical protein ABSE43_12270 [Steroidobacteraceae bacterium]|jgi:hypothetical protein